MKKRCCLKVRSEMWIRALVRLRCGNMEEINKYWLEEKDGMCKLCGKGKDCLDHFIDHLAKRWFNNLEKNKRK